MKFIRSVIEKSLLEHSKGQLRILIWMQRRIVDFLLVCCGVCLHAGAYDCFAVTVGCIMFTMYQVRFMDRVRKNHDKLAKHYFAPDDKYWEERKND